MEIVARVLPSALKAGFAHIIIVHTVVIVRVADCAQVEAIARNLVAEIAHKEITVQTVEIAQRPIPARLAAAQGVVHDGSAASQFVHLILYQVLFSVW